MATAFIGVPSPQSDLDANADIPKAPDTWAVIEEFKDGSVWLQRTDSSGKVTTYHAKRPKTQIE